MLEQAGGFFDRVGRQNVARCKGLRTVHKLRGRAARGSMAASRSSPVLCGSLDRRPFQTGQSRLSVAASRT